MTPLLVDRRDTGRPCVRRAAAGRTTVASHTYRAITAGLPPALRGICNRVPSSRAWCADASDLRTWSDGTYRPLPRRIQGRTFHLRRDAAHRGPLGASATDDRTGAGASEGLASEIPLEGHEPSNHEPSASSRERVRRGLIASALPTIALRRSGGRSSRPGRPSHARPKRAGGYTRLRFGADVERPEQGRSCDRAIRARRPSREAADRPADQAPQRQR